MWPQTFFARAPRQQRLRCNSWEEITKYLKSKNNSLRISYGVRPLQTIQSPPEPGIIVSCQLPINNERGVVAYVDNIFIIKSSLVLT